MPEERISVTYTGIIWVGLIMVVLGAIIAALGLGGTTAFEINFGDFKASATSVGLAIAIVGAFLSGIVALKLPAGVQVLEPGEKYTLTERLKPILIIVCPIIVIIGIICLILTIW